MLSSKQLRVRDLFKGRRAISHIERLCDFGDRFVGTAGDAAAIGYVQGEFERLGLEVSLSPVRVPGFVNHGARLSLGAVISTPYPRISRLPLPQRGSRRLSCIPEPARPATTMGSMSAARSSSFKNEAWDMRASGWGLSRPRRRAEARWE